MNSPLVILGLCCLSLELGSTIDFALDVGPGKEECFFQLATVNQVITAEYSVIRASQGENDILFKFTESRGTEFARDNSSDGSYGITVLEDDLYQICLDNTFSTFSVKTVFLSVTVVHEDEVEAGWKSLSWNTLTPDTFNFQEVKEIKRITNRVRLEMMTMQMIQRGFRKTELKDKSLLERNYELINNWSMANLLVLIFVGLIQVVMLRSLFESPKEITMRLAKLKQFKNNFK